jgi:hypothetical protein
MVLCVKQRSFLEGIFFLIYVHTRQCLHVGDIMFYFPAYGAVSDGGEVIGSNRC